MEIFLATNRLLFRRFTTADPDLLVELDSDPEVMRYINGGKPTKRIHIETGTLPAMLRDYERFPGLGAFAAITKGGNEFIGWFMLLPDPAVGKDTAELGYRLRKRFWGKGYATEGALALVRHGFVDADVRRIYAETMAVNTGSRRVMEKVGLQYELTYFPPFAPIEGSEHGEVRYTLDREEWYAASMRKNLQDLS
jgi:RimJ/RimL family protein N-acetyltransferase